MEKKDYKMLSQEPTIADTAIIRNCELSEYTEIAGGVKLVESELGRYSYVMERSDIIYTTIGKFVNIASDVRINPGNHPMDWVSQHHFLYRRKQYGFHESDDESFFNWRRMQRVTLGHDIWIGHGVILLPGVKIGNGAVVAAGSIVTKDVPPFTVVAGVPAKPIRQRFPQAISQSLEEISWWDWDHETIHERLHDFYDIRRFIHLYGERA